MVCEWTRTHTVIVDAHQCCKWPFLPHWTPLSLTHKSLKPMGWVQYLVSNILITKILFNPLSSSLHTQRFHVLNNFIVTVKRYNFTYKQENLTFWPFVSLYMMCSDDTDIGWTGPPHLELLFVSCTSPERKHPKHSGKGGIDSLIRHSF